MLDRVPYWLLMSLMFVPGPFLIAAFYGAGVVAMVLAPMGGAIVGYCVARYALRDWKLPPTATFGEVRPKLTAKS